MKGDKGSLYAVIAVAVVGLFVLALVAWTFMTSTAAQNAATLSAQEASEKRTDSLENFTWWSKLYDTFEKFKGN